MKGRTRNSRENGYRRRPITDTLFVLHKLGKCVRWAEPKEKSGVFRSQKSEIRGKVVKEFVRICECALRLRGYFLRERAAMYAAAITVAGA